MAQSNKILSFSKDAPFYYNLAKRSLDKGNYSEAIFYLKSAAALEEESSEYSIELAKTYALASRYEQSNLIYFKLLAEGKAEGKCFFGLSQNLYFLNDLEHSIYYLNLYMDKYAQGAIISDDDDEEYIEIIEEDDYSGYSIVHPVEKQDMSELINTARNHMKSGHFEEAADLLKNVKKGNPDYIFARNNLALCYFFMGDYNMTKFYCKEVLSYDPKNIFALCNLAAMYNYISDSHRSNIYLQRIINIETDDLTDLFKIATTLCELKQHELALKYLKRILKIKPYDNNIMFLTAIAYYNTKMIDSSEDIFLQLLRLNNGDYAAKYYLDFINTVKKDKDFEKGFFQPLEYICQVPYGEMVERIQRLKTMLKASKADFSAALRKNNLLIELCDWSFPISDFKTQKNIVNKFLQHKTKDTLNFLRHKLLEPEAPINIKKYIIEQFIVNNIPPKYSVNIDYAIKNVYPILTTTLKGEKVFYQAYAIAYSSIIANHSVKAESDLFAAYKKVLAAARLAEFKTSAKNLIAAVIVYVSKDIKLKKLQKNICAIFKVSVAEFEKCMGELGLL